MSISHPPAGAPAADWLLHAGLTNAVAATVLAAAVALICRLPPVRRRPAVVHGLWLVVLLKLVVPPLWAVSVSRPPQPTASSVGAAAAPVLAEAPVQADVEAEL